MSFLVYVRWFSFLLLLSLSLASRCSSSLLPFLPPPPYFSALGVDVCVIARVSVGEEGPRICDGEHIHSRPTLFFLSLLLSLPLTVLLVYALRCFVEASW